MIASLSTSSLATRAFALARAPQPAAGDAPKSEPLRDAERYVEKSLKLLDKLDRALDALRDDGPGRGRGHAHGHDRGHGPDDRGRRVGYDASGRLPGLQGFLSSTGTSSVSLAAASLSQTEVSIGPDGISYSKTELSVGRLETDRGTVDVVSLDVTRAYLGFGSSSTSATGGRTA
jgi:hypothetical protein